MTTLGNLRTATLEDLALLHSATYRAGADADLRLIEAEIARRKTPTSGDALREEITRIDLARMDIDADGPLSDEMAASLARVHATLRARVIP